MNEILEIVQGSVKPFEVLIKDENENPEDLSGAVSATLSIKEDIDQSATVLFRSTDAGNLTIDIPNSKLQATLLQAEADAFVPGDYIGGINVKIGTEWFPSDPFIIRILARVSDPLP